LRGLGSETARFDSLRRLSESVVMIASSGQVRLAAAKPLVLGIRDESQDDEQDDR
jgi:hypothetical protein